MRTLEVESKPPLAEYQIGRWHSVDLGQQSIGMRTYIPSVTINPTAILVDPIAFSVHASKPRDVQRSSILAEQTGLVTVGLEMPGMGPGSSPLTREQKSALRRGDWSVLGASQWEAIRTALAEEGIDLAGKEVHFKGFSMGVSSMIGLIESAPEDIDIGKIIAWEGVAWAPKRKVTQYLNIGGLLMRMMASGRKLGTYQKKLSPGVPQSLREELRTEAETKVRHKNKLGSWLLPVVAMAKGQDSARLANALSARATENTQVFLWNGDKSPMSRTRANRHAAKVLELAGIPTVVEHDEDGRHGVEDALYVSIPRITGALAA